MNKNETVQNASVSKSVTEKKRINPFNVILPVLVIILIIAVMFVYTFIQRKNVIQNAEQVTNQMAEYMAGSIANEIEYAKSSIKLSAVMIAQTMTSPTLENPSEVIRPMTGNTPFGGIEYIRADGMNVMNIGEPFDASDRVYYIEGIKGNTGIWNNYHPKMSKETLVNFYTPLIYNNEIVGVITGYIEATRQLSPLFETKLYGKPIYGLLVDDEDMVICSTIESEFVKDLSLDMFMDRFHTTDEQKKKVCATISNATEKAQSFKDPSGEGRICVTTIPGTNWKIAIIIPAVSFNEILNDNTRYVLVTIAVISAILIAYAAFVLIRNVKRRKDIAKENKKLEAENQRASAEITEIRDIIASANMGTWRIEIVEGKQPRMFVDKTMKSLLGISEQEEHTPEETYTDWFANIKPEAVQSVLDSVERMEQGYFDENTYLWIHPTKGVRYVRCGGTAQKIDGGFLICGYHYDVDEVVRKEQAQTLKLQQATENNKEYDATLNTIGDTYYSMHVIDLVEDTVKEFSARNEVKEIVNQKHGAVDMMVRTMNAVTSDEYKESALEFTNLLTVAERMKNKKVISKQFIGKNVGWFLISFITMEKDEEGKPTKVICTTSVIDEEKKQEEILIKKSQTDELTGFLNRRAYEEDIYANNNTPDSGNFIYVSLDVNGLKVVNDTLGHLAGDELLTGSCQCMKKSLGSYGRLYRTGGDEFVAILFCDEAHVKEIFEDFDETIASWQGNLVESLSISYGWISREENPEATVRQLGAIADQRMYAAKSEHYKKTGVDRRGQQDAHKALCALYTKILKINVSDDTFHIINMDIDEKTIEKGFSDKISEWLRSFGLSGQVHADDLQEYLRKTDLQYMKDYFSEGKSSLHIFYRRKYGEGFKKVMMEIIPASDYSIENQTLFLYVKEID